MLIGLYVSQYCTNLNNADVQQALINVRAID